MTAFPGAEATFTGFTSSHTLAQDQHASQHNLEQSEIVAIQHKIGTGASTPASNLVLRGTDVGTSAWSQVILTSDVTGVLPVANGGTGGTTAATARTSLGVNTLAELLPSIYPIGCIYTEITGTNPATTFGFGTWSQFAQGQVLVGQKPADTDFQTVLATGGEKTHTLTSTEMPSHTHSYATDRGGVTYAGGAFNAKDSSLGAAGSTTGSTGSDGAHNNLQPFCVVYFWRRTL